jgi:hypothetical protein
MSQVYTFCRSKSTSDSGHKLPNPPNSAKPTQQTGSVGESGYTFRTNTSEPKQVSFTESDFPALGEVKPAISETKVGCWGNTGKIDLIKKPPTDPVVPRKVIPPIFAKATKTVKKQFYDEEYYEEDGEYGEYEDDEADEGEGVTPAVDNEEVGYSGYPRYPYDDNSLEDRFDDENDYIDDDEYSDGDGYRYSDEDIGEMKFYVDISDD